METNTETSPAVDTTSAVPVAAGNNANVVDKGTHKLELVEFTKGDKEGFSFYKVEYKSLDYIKDTLFKGDKEKADAYFLGTVNRQIDMALRNRANARWPGNDEFAVVAGGPTVEEQKNKAILEAKTSGATLLVTADEAESYVPGTREKTSIPALYKELKACVEAGQHEDALEIMQTIKRLNEAKELELMAALGIGGGAN